MLTPEPGSNSARSSLSTSTKLPAPPATSGTENTQTTLVPPSSSHSSAAADPPKPPAPLAKPGGDAARALPKPVAETTVSAPARRERTPSGIIAQRAEPAAARPKGLRKLFALMTCSSSSATQAAALEQPAARPQVQAAVRPKSLPSSPSSMAGPQPVPPKSEPTQDVLPSTVVIPASASNSPPASEEDARLPSRDSVIGPPSTAHTDEPDEYGGGIIASVGQNTGMPLPYDTDLVSEQELFAEEQRLINQGGTGVLLDEHGNPTPLLPAVVGSGAHRKCLVLDLDETLVHSSFKMVPNADFVVPVEIDGVTHNVYVIKRPGVDEFLRRMGQLYEVVIFTASLNKYADPVIDILDIHQVVDHRLFRESCYNHHGNYVKDLSQLGRPLHDTIILDNSPASYIFHPSNAVPVSSWFNDPHDTELTDLSPFLQDLVDVDDIRLVLDGFIRPG